MLGESGSGKSVTAQADHGHPRHAAGADPAGRDPLPRPGHADDVRARSAARSAAAKIAMIFQDALSSLNPVLSRRLPARRDVPGAPGRCPARRPRPRPIELMDRVRIPAARERVNDYPHQFSGGMRQRIMIAMALALEPDLIIADEPTTALDVTVQAQVMDLLAELQREYNMGLILITHDLGVVADVADKIAVMYAGRIVETRPGPRALQAPRAPVHPGPARTRSRGWTRRARSSTRSRACRPTCCTSRPAAPSTRAARWRRTSAAPRSRRCSGHRAGRRRAAGRGSACHFWKETIDG